MVQEFDGIISQRKEIYGTYVEIPFDVEKVFGAKRVKVAASFDGCGYRGAVVRMGGCYLICIPRQICTAIGKSLGAAVHVTLEKEKPTPVIRLPAELRALLEEHPKAKSLWYALTPGEKRAHIDRIESAKREKTRLARAEKVLEALTSGMKN